MATLAKGGRLNIFGFFLRLIARLPFLIIGGRIYGAEALGRFAFAVIVVEFTAQLATMGLKRGLAKDLAKSEKPESHIVTDALLVAGIGALIGMTILGLFPKIIFPNTSVEGLDRLIPIVVLAVAWMEISLAALAYRGDIKSTVRARSVIEPWTISIVAFIWSYISLRDGLIIAYIVSMCLSMLAAMVPLVREYGRPRGWKPDLPHAWRVAKENMPLAAADAIEWGSRRLDIAVLTLFMSPAFVGIYYVAQQVATLPQKLKTSFDPVLGPAIARGIKAKDYSGIAKQLRQVGFWILAAQAGIAIALAIPGSAVMNVVGEGFSSGAATLAFLLAAEVIAATAVVSEAALVYLARHRNMVVSFVMLGIEAALAAGFIIAMRDAGWPETWQATGPAIALCLALGFASVVKSRMLAKILGEPVAGWRWHLVLAGLAAFAVGIPIRAYFPDTLQMIIGIPMIMIAFGAVLWTRGFKPEDRALFRKTKGP